MLRKTLQKSEFEISPDISGERLKAELLITRKALDFQQQQNNRLIEQLNIESESGILEERLKRKRAAELIVANQELFFQNMDKEKRAAELIVANEELVFQNQEKEKRAAELVIALRELAIENEKKEQRAAELLIANAELAHQNIEKGKRAEELFNANAELAIQIERRKKIEENLERIVQERTRGLHDALRKEKELVEMKSKFISIASHEFRTPLSAIFLSTGFLRKYMAVLKPAEINTKLDKIEKQVHHMTLLLDDVLSVGKAEAAEIATHYSTVPTTCFKELALEAMSSMDSRHNLKFELSCDIDTIITDKKLIHSIIVNLITNAVKFSRDADEIVMNVWCENDLLFITVQDKGIGILDKDLDELFTSFARGSNVGEIEGTGLGLSIVKKSVQLLNGQITVSSSAQQGTTFKVSLPL